MENRHIGTLLIKYFDFCACAHNLINHFTTDQRFLTLENMELFIKKFKPHEYSLSSWDSISWWISSNVMLSDFPKFSVEHSDEWLDHFITIKSMSVNVRAEYLLEIMEFEFDERIGNGK